MSVALASALTKMLQGSSDSPFCLPCAKYLRSERNALSLHDSEDDQDKAEEGFQHSAGACVSKACWEWSGMKHVHRQ